MVYPRCWRGPGAGCPYCTAAGPRLAVIQFRVCDVNHPGLVLIGRDGRACGNREHMDHISAPPSDCAAVRCLILIIPSGKGNVLKNVVSEGKRRSCKPSFFGVPGSFHFLACEILRSPSLCRQEVKPFCWNARSGPACMPPAKFWVFPLSVYKILRIAVMTINPGPPLAELHNKKHISQKQRKILCRMTTSKSL